MRGPVRIIIFSNNANKEIMFEDLYDEKELFKRLEIM